MSKRFTDTTKWINRPWFRRLTPVQKCLWLYLCDSCDEAGVFALDLDMASFVIGAVVTEADFGAMSKQVVQLDCGKWWLSDFVSFQYGSLSESCPPHRKVLHVLKGYRKGNGTLLDRVQDKEEDKEKDKEGGPGGDRKAKAAAPADAEQSLFVAFVKAYPGRSRGVRSEFDNFRKHHKDWRDCINLLMPALESERDWHRRRQAAGGFVPNWKHLQTWLNNRCWEQTLEDVAPAGGRKVTGPVYTEESGMFRLSGGEE